MRDEVKKRVLVVYYSFTQQTRILLKQFCAGLEEEGIDVFSERLEPVNPYEFPFQSDVRLVTVMMRTFFKGRKEVQPISDKCFENWDYVVIAGPTWSYFPSGPILDFLDRYGEKVLAGKKVIPFISCRSYWRLNSRTLAKRCKKLGAESLPPVVFEHPTREPYRVLGLLLKLRGKMIRSDWFRKNYESYGHNKAQAEEAFEKGQQLGKNISAI
jgi:hypothetical protein